MLHHKNSLIILFIFRVTSNLYLWDMNNLKKSYEKIDLNKTWEIFMGITH